MATTSRANRASLDLDQRCPATASLPRLDEQYRRTIPVLLLQEMATVIMQIFQSLKKSMVMRRPSMRPRREWYVCLLALGVF